MRYIERIDPTKERTAKGRIRPHYDERGQYLSCTAIPDTILAVLIERGRLPEHLADAAHAFLELRDSFLARQRTKTPKYGDEPHKPTGLAASRYLAVCRKLGRARTRLALDASTPGWTPALPVSLDDYKDAFERLDRAMGEARREVTQEAVDQELAKWEAR